MPWVECDGEFYRVMSSTKVCRTCGEQKPIGMFYKDRANRDGRKNMCGVCVKLYREALEEKRKGATPIHQWIDDPYTVSFQ
jgi:hypothetical protein